MNVRNQKNFFQKILLDDNGNMVINLNTKEGIKIKGDNQRKTFKKLTISEDGHLNTFED
mgnify:FL=1